MSLVRVESCCCAKRFLLLVTLFLLSDNCREPLEKVATWPLLAKVALQRVSGHGNNSAEEYTEEEENPNLAMAITAPIGPIDELPVATHLGEWVNRGPKNYGGKVHDLAIDPTHENIVYAAYGCYSDAHSTNGTGGGLWRTRNGGQSWRPIISADEDPCVLSVDVHPKKPQLVIAGLRGSSLNRHPADVRLSRDGGDTWESIGPPSDDPTLSIVAVKFDIEDPNTIYAATHKGLFKTVTTGQIWAKVLDYSGTSFWNDAPSLARHPADPKTLILSVRSLGVQRTRDGGMSWTRVDDTMDQTVPVTVVAWSSSDSQVVYAERISGEDPRRQMLTYRSTDGGQTWSPRAVINAGHQGRYDMSIAVDPSNPEHVIIGNTSMRESTDGLQTTRSVRREPHSDQLATVFAPSNPNTVYNGNDGGVWKSTDGGRTWSPCDWGVRTNHAYSFAIYPGSGIINFSAADYGAIVFDPQDPQENGWHNSDCGFEYRANYVNPFDGSDAYVAGRPQRVGDGQRDCQTIDPAPAESKANRVPVAFDPANIYVGLGHIWKSSDRGTTWKPIGINDDIAARNHLNAFQVAPSDPQTLYALTNQNGNLWATRDAGESWSSIHTFASPRALAVMPDKPDALFVGTDMGTDERHGLFISSDGGAHFERLTGFPDNLPINKIIIDRDNTSRVFVATGRGVLLSKDTGKSWARLGREMPAGIVADAALQDDRGGRTLWATSDQGLWSMALNGQGACEQSAVVSPKQVRLGSSGGRVRIDISIASSCAWMVESSADWVDVETYGEDRGPAVVDLNVQANRRGTREATLTIAGQSIPLQQLGGPDPIAPDAVITISDGERCLASSAGDILEMQPCDPEASRQQFRLEAIRPLLYHVVTDGGRCLDTRKTRLAGIRLRHDVCQGNREAQQLFEFVPEEGGWRLRGNMAGHVPGPEGHSLMCQESRDGHLEQQPCNGTVAQRFQISLVSSRKD